MRDLGALAIRNPAGAGLLAGGFAVMALRLPFFAILSGGLVAFATLRSGWRSGMLAVALAGALLAVGYGYFGARPGLAVPLAPWLWLPLLVMAGALRRSGSQHIPLLLAAGVMAAFVIGAYLLTGDPARFWRDWLEQAIAAVPGSGFTGFRPGDDLRLINGFMGILYGLALMLSLWLARWLQGLADGQRTLADEFRRLELPKGGLVFAVGLVWAAGLVEPGMMVDLLMQALLVYGIAGLAVIHGVLAVRGMTPRWLAVAYLMLALFPPEAVAVLALVGALDAFIRFREQGES